MGSVKHDGLSNMATQEVLDFTTLETTTTPSVLPLITSEYPLPSHLTSSDPPEQIPTTSILSLPVEILLRITHFVDLPPHPKPSTKPPFLPDSKTSPTARTYTLRSLRLAHPFLTHLSIPYLFSHLTLPVWGENGLLRLHNITSHDHLARHVQHLKIFIQFNVAEPHAAPFSEHNLRRGSEPDLLGRVPPPRTRDRWRRKVSETLDRGVERLSLERLTAKGRKKSTPSATSDPKAQSPASPDGIEPSRSMSIASISSGDDSPNAQQVNKTTRFPDPHSRPGEFLATFDSQAITTISRNFGASDRDLPRYPDSFSARKSGLDPNFSPDTPSTRASPSPILLALAKFMEVAFTSLSRLQTLCIDSQTQEEFMERLDRSFALRFAPTQDTWDAISGYVVGMLIAGWVRSGTQSVRRLWVLGGATEWGARLGEYMQALEDGSEEAVQTTDDETQTQKCKDRITSLDHWTQKASKLESVSLKYDDGAYRRSFEAVETRWVPMVQRLLRDMPNLQYLEMAKQRRADGTSNTNVEGGVHFLPSLKNLANSESSGASSSKTTTTTPSKLRLLRISDFSSYTPDSFITAVHTFSSPSLQTLLLGDFALTSYSAAVIANPAGDPIFDNPTGPPTLPSPSTSTIPSSSQPIATSNDWPTAWKLLGTTPHFQLKQFILTGKRYSDTYGFWRRTPAKITLDVWGGGDLERRVRSWVETAGRKRRRGDTTGGGGGRRIRGRGDDGEDDDDEEEERMPFPLPTTAEMEAWRAVKIWEERGGDGLRYVAS